MKINNAVAIFLMMGIISLGQAEYGTGGGMTYVSEKDVGQNCQYDDLLNQVILAKNIGVDQRRQLLAIKEEMEELKTDREAIKEEMEELKTDRDNLEDIIF